MFAFQRSSGELTWQQDFKSGFHAEPIVDGTTYVVPVDDGTVAALDATSGALLWRTTVGPKGIFNGLLEAPGLAVGALHGSFFSLAMETGEFVAGGAGALAMFSPRLEPASGNGLMAFVTPEDKIEAIDLVSGESSWIADLGVSPSSAPVAAPDGFLIATADRRLFLLAYETGEIQDTFDVPVVLEDRPLLIDTTLVATARGGSLAAVNTFNGELAWQRNDRRWSSPRLAMIGDAILAGSTDGVLAAIDPLFGESVWELQLQGVLTGFVSAGNEIYAGNTDGTIFAVRIPEPDAGGAASRRHYEVNTLAHWNDAIGATEHNKHRHPDALEHWHRLVRASCTANERRRGWRSKSTSDVVYQRAYRLACIRITVRQVSPSSIEYSLLQRNESPPIS